MVCWAKSMRIGVHKSCGGESWPHAAPCMQSECKVKVGTLCRYLTSHGCEHWSLKQAIRLTGTPQTTATIHHCLQSAHEECHYVGKHNYSRGVVQEIYIHDNMVPSLRRLVPKLQTKSWKGISGHGIAVDGYQEKVNNAAERIVGRVVQRLGCSQKCQS